MNPPMKREENEPLMATENDQSTRPEVSKDTVMRQTCSGTPAGRSPSDNGECSGTIKLKREVSGRDASLKIQNPNMSIGEKVYFTFTLNETSGRSDRRSLTAFGELNESIYSALEGNEDFRERMKKHFNKNIIVYEEKTIRGHINLGMPLKCLPTDSHLKISVGQRKRKEREDDQLLRLCESPNIECILFQVLAIGKTLKKIVKIKELHEKGSTLCIYALKGETVKEALCKDGRFRSDLDEFEWKLVENHRNIHGKQSTVEEVSGKILEMDIYKKSSIKKRTPKKIEQKNENAPGEIGPRDLMPSQIQVHEPETDGETEGVEHKRGKVLAPPSPEHDIEGKKRRTVSRIKRYYSNSLRRKYRKQNARVQQRPLLRMQQAINQETTDLWLQNCKVLDKGIMQRYPHFSEDARWMRNYFREEQRRTKLLPFQQFNMYKKCFAKVTKMSCSVASCELCVHLSKSVGFMIWNYNGITGNATCFVFNDCYLFTCRHVVHMMVGEGTDRSLWPDIISKCAKVTFNYKTFYPPAEEWFFLQPWVEVPDGALDYAILKLRENGNGFPPSLFGQYSPLPQSGLIYLIGHPEGRTKEMDPCAVITVQERLGRYSEHLQLEAAGPPAATYGVCSMFTQRSFPAEAWSTDAVSYDTCFSTGSSGSPVFDASGKVVAVHSFGKFYKRGNKEHAFIEFGYSLESILRDVKQRNEALYISLTEENNENLNQEKTNKQERALQNHHMEPMDH